MIRAAIPIVALLCVALAQAAARPQGQPGSRPQASQRQGERPPLSGAHPAITKAGDAGCLECHAVQQQHKVLHGPVAVGACTSCHVVNDAGGTVSVGLIGGPSPDRLTGLCVGCHEDIAEKLTLSHVHAPVAGGACTTCHDPHGSPFPFMLPAEGPASCLACHADIADALGKGFTHAPAAKACVVCHDSHASKHPAQTREPLNALCLVCHYDQPDPEPDEPDRLLGRPAPALERAMTREGRRIPPRQRRDGRPSRRPPPGGREGQPRREVETDDVRRVPQPPRRGHRALFRQGVRNGMELCLACHKF